jgi:hypothetical protein
MEPPVMAFRQCEHDVIPSARKNQQLAMGFFGNRLFVSYSYPWQTLGLSPTIRKAMVTYHARHDPRIIRLVSETGAASESLNLMVLGKSC